VPRLVVADLECGAGLKDQELAPGAVLGATLGLVQMAVKVDRPVMAEQGAQPLRLILLQPMQRMVTEDEAHLGVADPLQGCLGELDPLG